MTGPQKFRKRPVLVEAMQWTGENETALWDWLGASFVGGHRPRLYVAANDAWVDLERTEWIIRDGLGFHPCKNAKFLVSYEQTAP